MSSATPLLLLLLAASLSSVSAYKSTSSYYYDSAANTSANIAAIITLFLGLWVTYAGLKSMRMTFFVATLTVLGTIIAFTGSTTVVSIIVLVLALIVAWVKSLYKLGIFLLGMTTGLISALLVAAFFALILSSAINSDDSLITVFALWGILALILCLAYGVRALRLEGRFLRVATCLLGGFTVSTAAAALIEVNVRYPSPTLLFMVFILGGFIFFGCGMGSQRIDAYKNPFLAQSAAVPTTPTAEVATPAKSQEPYVSTV